jgi:CheY-like chemotaxis protein
MGGDIEVDSSPGRGATFIVRLVLRGVAVESPAAPAAVEDGRSVLLALDRRIERSALAAGLRTLGVTVIEADSADAEPVITTAAATALPIDTVVVDAHADPGEAATLLARARALRPDRKARGVLLIDAVARASLEQFRAAGFDSYLVRPVRPRALATHIAAPRHRTEAPNPLRREGRPRRGSGERVQGCRVLLAEDNTINALLARRMLEKAGCSVVHVVDGAAAVDAVRRTLDGDEPPFDVVLMDLHMPRLGGIEATAELRGLVARSAGFAVALPPIVALTANAFPEDRQRCLRAGLDDYLAKPFDRQELLALLERWRARGTPALTRTPGDAGNAA